MKDWQKEAIEEGIASAERGELTPLDEVKAKWEAIGAVEIVAWGVWNISQSNFWKLSLSDPKRDYDICFAYGNDHRFELQPLGRISDFSRARAADRAEIERLLQHIADLEEARDGRVSERLAALDALSRERDQLRAELAEVRKDAERYRLLESRATQATAYDIHGNGGNWTVSIYSNDRYATYGQAIDAAISAQQQGEE